jgi:hypothetical protein
MPSSFGTLMPLLKVGNLMHQHLGRPWASPYVVILKWHPASILYEWGI